MNEFNAILLLEKLQNISINDEMKVFKLISRRPAVKRTIWINTSCSKANATDVIFCILSMSIYCNKQTDYTSRGPKESANIVRGEKRSSQNIF